MIQKSLFFTLTLLVALAGAVGAEDRLTQSAMRSAGMEAGSVQPISFSHDERTLAVFDRAPFEEKKEGVFYRLWFIKIGRDGKMGEPRKVPLPLRNLQQGEFTPDDSAFVVLGDRGTRFYRVDVESLEVTPILEPKWGQSGFRADPAVLWTFNNTMYVLGHPYDQARFISPKTIATVTRDGRIRTDGPNLALVERNLERLWFTNYEGPSSAFFGQKYPTTTLLSHWDGKKVYEIDRASSYYGFWCNAGRILYSAERAPELNELVVYDTSKSEKSVLASGPKAYRYLFLSQDGQTALTSVAVGDGRLEPYVARSSRNWKLQPLVTDRQGQVRSVPAGWMRISANGTYVCHVSGTGMVLYSLK